MQEKNNNCCLWLGGYFLFLPLILLVAWRNEYTKDILLTGWTPVLMAMLIR
jgi:hypothetical protein